MNSNQGNQGTYDLQGGGWVQLENYEEKGTKNCPPSSRNTHWCIDMRIPNGTDFKTPYTLGFYHESIPEEQIKKIAKEFENGVEVHICPPVKTKGI